MSGYFFWAGIIFHVAAAFAASLVLIWLFVEWYLKVFKMKREFLLWYREKLIAKKEADRT